MPEAPSLTDRISARMERLAEMDMAAAEKAHAQLMAAETPEETASMMRAYQRASRTLRQTLMLQMKHARDQATVPAAPERNPGPPDSDRGFDRFMNNRVEEIQDAIGRVAAAAHPDHPRLQREALDCLDLNLDEWSGDPDFIIKPVDELVAYACERLGLPPELARRWRDLPPPAETFDPAEMQPLVTDTG